MHPLHLLILPPSSKLLIGLRMRVRSVNRVELDQGVGLCTRARARAKG